MAITTINNRAINRADTAASDFQAVGGANTPAFHAKLSSTQTPSNDTEQKINVNTEDFDIDNCYDNSTNYRFTPTTAGKYWCYGQTTVYGWRCF